jgi:hypothetical protein
MKQIVPLAALALAALALFAQQQRNSGAPVFEFASVLPHETSPGQYRQVENETLQSLTSQGWELVGVTPYIYRNEEHNNGEMHGPKPVVTQVYPAYFFKRVRTAR